MYIVLSLFLVFVAFVLSVAFLVFFFGMVSGAEYFNEKNRAWVFMGISLPLISKYVSNFLLLISFWICADNDLIGINAQSSLPNVIVLRTTIVLIVSGLLVIVCWMMFKQNWGVVPYDYYEFEMKEKLTKDRIHEIFTSSEKPPEQNQLMVENDQEANKN